LFAHGFDLQKSDTIRVYDLDEQFYQHPNGTAEILALRLRVEIVVLKKRDNVTLNKLSDYCGQPLRIRRVVNGTLWSYHHWAK
jgi:hypothetical protein